MCLGTDGIPVYEVRPGVIKTDREPGWGRVSTIDKASARESLLHNAVSAPWLGWSMDTFVILFQPSPGLRLTGRQSPFDLTDDAKAGQHG